jgi:hypothetical protein
MARKNRRIFLSRIEPDTRRWRMYVEVLPLGILSLSPHRGRCRTTRLEEYKNTLSTDSPLLPLLIVMYYVRVSLRTVKIFLAQH